MADIDSALLSALSRERVFLLRMEQTLEELVQSPHEWVSVGGPNLVRWPGDEASATTGASLTSFQRCVVHRLADRFGVAREPEQDGLRLVKTAQTQLPAHFLRDHGANTRTKPQVKKMVIMKRSSNGSLGSSGSLQNREAKHAKKPTTKQTPMKLLPKADLSERERAYAEARARIFEGHTEEILEEESTGKAVYRDRSAEAADPDFQRFYPSAHAAPFYPKPS